MTIGPISHGGRQHAIRKRLGLGDRPLLDFSASLNPLGPPPSALAAAREAIDRCCAYPEPGCPRLTTALAARHRVPEECIIVGAGTSELIGLIAQAMRDPLGRMALRLGEPSMPTAHLVEPSYGEYRRASMLNGLVTRAHPRPTLGWRMESLPGPASGLFWTGNPTSPMGLAWDRDDLLRAVDSARDLLVVVDEAFLPFFPDEAGRTTTSAAASRPNLLALRSVTKIYAMPGLRVGYAVGPADLVDHLRRYQNPWSVDAPSQAALLAALGDGEYIGRSIELIGPESVRLHDRLWDIRGVRPAWPSRRRPEDTAPLPNWVLVSLIDTPWTSPRVHEELARRGILVRECSDFPELEPGAVITGPDRQAIPARGHLRFAVRTRAENDRLLATLTALLAEEPPKRSTIGSDRESGTNRGLNSGVGFGYADPGHGR